MSSESISAASGHLSSAIRQLTKTQSKKVLLGLVEDAESADFLLERLTLHVHRVLEEDRLSPVPDAFMEQELEAVDALLDSYTKSADKKLLSDVTVKIHDLFVILQSRAKDQKWQHEVQQRANRLNGIRGKNFPDPSIFNTGFQKRGWMDKRTRSFKGWKRRWCVLKGNHLTYFAKTEATVASSTEWGEVIQEGSLRKKKQGKGWKTRWVQIRPEGLLYFKTQKDKEPIGALSFAESERVENSGEKSFEITCNGVKYFFSVENEDDFPAWSGAFAGVCPEGHHPNMSYFTIRGVIDLSSAVLDDKQNDKPYCFSITAEGGKTFVFSVDSERQKQDWLNLIGPVVKVDSSSRKTSGLRVQTGSGILKQLSFTSDGSGRTTPTNGPDSPAVVRFAFKDEVLGRSLAVRNEGDNFDAKFQADEMSEDEEEEEKEEGEEAARERTKIVRRDTIKLIRTFKLEVNLEDQKEIYTFAFDNSVLVDQVKSYLFKHIPALAGCNQSDYSLGVDENELLTVEFLRFVSSSTFIEVAVRTCGIARVGLYLRDNLKKINEQRAARGRPLLKGTTELQASSEQQRQELEHRLLQERLEQEKFEQELQRRREEELQRQEREKSVQTEEKSFTSASTQTEKEGEEEKEKEKPTKAEGAPTSPKEGDKISWRNQTTQILPSSLKKEHSKTLTAVPSSGSISANGEAKPKTMITKTNPRPPEKPSVWQHITPSVSATKRPMIIPCEGWSVEVPGEPLPAGVKSWQFAIHMDNSISEIPEPFFYRKYFISAKKTTNFLGSDPKYGSISFSMCSNPDGYRGVLFTKLGTRQICVPTAAVKAQGPSMKSRKQQLVHLLLSKLEPNINPKHLRVSLHPDMQKELLSLEERQVCSGFKFGVVYAKGGQTDENELFNNEHGSDEWNEFLELLGTRIQLKGWTQYNAGLDVKGNNTGTHSMYTNWKGNEIMFHVSTMLPYHSDDPQKLERKRHVGNDICVIIYQEGSTPYLPTTITSHFNHIVAVVHYDKSLNGYRLGFAYKDGVPAFGPVLPSQFVKRDELKEFLLTKLINGETASLLAPVFAQKLVRTREALLNYYLQQFL